MSEGSRLPLVSIIITSYNRAPWIDKAIQSSLAQDYANLEIIITDNCSTDNSDEVIRKYVADPRIHYSRNASNIGMLGNFKKGTNELAKGEYVLYVSSDDYLKDPGFVSSAISLFLTNTDMRLVFGKFATFNFHSGQDIQFYQSSLWDQSCRSGKDVFFQYPSNGFLCFGGCLFKRKDIIDFNVFEMGHVNFDVECILKIMLLGDVGFSEKEAYVFTRHGDNQSGSMNMEAQLNKLTYIEEVADFAKKKLGEAYTIRLTDWKDQILNNSIKGSLYFMKMHKSPIFKEFYSYIKKHYSRNYKMMVRDLSWYAKIKISRKLLLFLYKHFKPSYYRQEFEGETRQITG